MKIYFSIFLGLAFSTVTFAQSAWTQKKGKSYFQAQFNTIPEYGELYPDNDENDPLFSTRLQTQRSLNFYGEYGLTDKTTLITHIPIVYNSSGKLNPDANLFFPTDLPPISYTGAEEDLLALGNLELGLRQELYNKNIIISAELNTQLNTSSFQEKSGLRTGYDAVSFRPTINIGKGWNKSFLQGFGGATFRTNDYHQSINFGVEYGYKLSSKFWAIGNIIGVLNFEDSEKTLSYIERATYNYVSNQEYVSFGLKFIYEYKESLGFNLGLGGAFTAKNVAKSPSLALGVYTKL